MDQLVLERKAFLAELTLEHACVVDIERLLALDAFVFHVSVTRLFSRCLVFFVALGTAPLLLRLAEAQHLN